LGERIRKWRLEQRVQDLFQRDLAKKIGVSEMSIANCGKGREKPANKSLQRLEKILRAAKD